MTSEWAAAARLVRRTGFGATGTEVDAVVKQGMAAFVTRTLAADPDADAGARRTPVPHFEAVDRPVKDADADAKKARNKKLHAQGTQATAWWLRRMVAAESAFGEKSTFVWHGHFATSLKKVRDARVMLAQNQKLRTLGRGDFHTLASAVLTDAATLRWLDGEKNTVKGPNENLAREFMEIFTLGHSDGYTEQDVRQGARALTGLKINRATGATRLVPALHDNGSKTFLGVTGDLGPTQYCDAVLARPGGPAYIVNRLWAQYVSSTPPAKDVLARLTAAYGAKRDLKALFTALFTDPSFAAAEGSLIIGPTEWLIGSARILRVSLDDARSAAQAAGALDSLGQLPFYPPSVGGWPSGQVWASTAAADLRFRYAAMLVKQAQLPALAGSVTSRLEAVAHLLGVDTWSARSLAVLKGSASNAAQLVAVALNTPEYLVH
ncbi:DUF1800 family protein [uncultured Jatrophihabitans sp.]|uniref:DUF1800 domain-containing protein n=1 Tax=uncultured Jatrophihabitans sp. TaxID=1610747 RepID=UPI0035CCA61E